MSDSWIECINSSCPARRHVLGSEAQRECAELHGFPKASALVLDLRASSALSNSEEESVFGEVFAVITDRYGQWVTMELDCEGGESAQVQMEWRSPVAPTAQDALRHLAQMHHGVGAEASVARLQLQELLGERWLQVAQSAESAMLV